MNATLELPAIEFRDRLAGDDMRALCPDAQVVIDVGAGKGNQTSFCRQARIVWPNARIISLEPASRFNNTLQPMDDRHEVVRMAAGNYDGTVHLNLTSGPESNSILPFLPNNPLHKVHQVVGGEEVPVVRLDAFCSQRVDVLKMDAQGAELMVLDGAERILSEDRPIIYTEVSFQQVYGGQPLLAEMDEYLADRGYKRLYLYRSVMPDIWGDAIYVPDGISTPCQSAYSSNRISDHVNGAIRLNIGAGDSVIPGFTPIDRKFGTEAYPLNYPDNSVDEIRCSHMLEHLSFAEVPQALKEWHRVLKPGGRLRVSVPDIERVSKMTKSDPSWRFYIMGGQTDANDFHKSAFNAELLEAYFLQQGFDNIRTWTSTNTDLAASDISLNREGYKAGAEPMQQSQELKVRAVCGMPRIGWNDAWMSFSDALRPFNIPIETHQGCFWAQNIQKALERAQRDGIDWVITLDYDSMIMPCHVSRLIEIMGTRPEIDACAALQMRRGDETALMSNGGTEVAVTGWQPVKVNTAHFGLTIIRVECLKDLQRPWLIDVPDANGGFSDDHVDADIYFWNQWKAAGKTVYVAPDVRIGHLELLVSEYDEELKPRHYHVGKWWNLHAKAGHCMRTKKAE